MARRAEKIKALSEKLKGKRGKLYAVQADVSKEQDIINAFKWTTTNVGPVHILVNNAATAFITNLTEGNTELWKLALDLNVLGLCIATREAIKSMQDNNIEGHIININSVLGHKVPGAALNIYPATKYAVTAVTESLRHELNFIKSKIKVTVSN